MTNPADEPLAPLEIARDLLRQARIVLEDELAERPSKETEAAINALTQLLLQVRAIGNDNRWAV